MAGESAFNRVDRVRLPPPPRARAWVGMGQSDCDGPALEWQERIFPALKAALGHRVKAERPVPAADPLVAHRDKRPPKPWKLEAVSFLGRSSGKRRNSGICPTGLIRLETHRSRALLIQGRS